MPRPGAAAPAGAPEPAPPAAGGAVLRSRGALVLLLFLFGLAGAASMIYQVTWTRAISLVIGSTVYAFSLIVTAFILGLALGGMVFSTFVDRRKDPLLLLAGVEAAIGLSSLGLIVIFGDLSLYVVDVITAFGSRFWLLQTIFFAGVFLLILVPTFLMGGAFPIVSKIYTQSLAEVGRSVGTVYAFNTLGAIVGSFIAGFVLIPIEGLGLQGTMKVAVAMSLVVAAIVLLLSFRRFGVRPLSLLPAGAAVGTLFLLALVKPWTFEVMTSGAYVYALRYRDQVQEYKRATGQLGKPDRQALRELLLLPDILFKKEGVSATVGVKRDPESGRLYLAINGKTDASNDVDMLTQVLSGHLPMLFHGSAKNVCVVGLGSAVTLGSVLRYPVDHVDSIEISPEVYEAARYFAEDNYHALDDARVSPIVEDGRNHLALTAKRYDVIISEPSNPWISGIGALFTIEYFERCRDRMNPGGVYCQWANTYDMLPDDFRMVIRTFQHVFPHVTLWESVVGGDYLLVGAMEEKPIDITLLSERMSDPKVGADLERVGIRSVFDLLARFVMGGDDLVRYASTAPLHRDDNNRLEFTLPKNLYNPDKAVIQLQDLVQNRHSVLPFVTRSGAKAKAEDLAEIRERLGRNYEARRATLNGLLTLAEVTRRAHRTGDVDTRLLDEVEQSFGRAVALNPGDIEGTRELHNLYQMRAQWLLREGDLEGAATFYEKMIALRPGNEQVKRYYGMLLTQLGEEARFRNETAKALQYAERAVKAAPRSFESHCTMAEALWSSGKRLDAIQELKLARMLAPKEPRVLDRLAQFCLEGHPDPKQGAREAGELWYQAARLDPENDAYVINVASVYIRMQRYEEAVGILEPLARKAPRDTAVQHNLATALYRLQQWGAARQAYERFLAVEPDGAKAGEVYFFLGCCLAALSHTEAAIDALEKAADRDFATPKAYLSEPNLQGLHAHPRFQELQRKLALRHSGSPPQTYRQG
jgi:spermidine synthase/tetratricopeptide (TPR) repeat protein